MRNGSRGGNAEGENLKSEIENIAVTIMDIKMKRIPPFVLLIVSIMLSGCHSPSSFVGKPGATSIPDHKNPIVLLNLTIESSNPRVLYLPTYIYVKNVDSGKAYSYGNQTIVTKQAKLPYTTSTNGVGTTTTPMLISVPPGNYHIYKVIFNCGTWLGEWRLKDSGNAQDCSSFKVASNGLTQAGTFKIVVSQRITSGWQVALSGTMNVDITARCIEMSESDKSFAREQYPFLRNELTK